MLSDIVRCAWPYLPGLWPGMLAPIVLGFAGWIVLAWTADVAEKRGWPSWPVWAALVVLVIVCSLSVIRQVEATVTACPNLQPPATAPSVPSQPAPEPGSGG